MTAGCSMAVAAAVTGTAAVAATAATTTPATTTHGGMQPVLEQCCDPLIRGSDAGGVREEERRFSVWLSLLTAGKNGGECSTEGDGLRAESGTKDEREQTPSARVLHPTQQPSFRERRLCPYNRRMFAMKYVSRSRHRGKTPWREVGIMPAAHLDFGASMGWFKVLILCSCRICNPATTPNSKHIDIRHHFIRGRGGNGECESGVGRRAWR